MASLKNELKRIILSFTTLTKLMQLTSARYPRVFVYHRFSRRGTHLPHRVSADAFAWQLDQIVKYFNVMTLGECLAYLKEHGQWPKRAAVLTIDDGYSDFYDYAFPELQKRGLKATFFVTVNFVEQLIWLWPDRLHYALTETSKCEVSAELHGFERTFPICGQAEKQSAWHFLTDYCIGLPDDEKWELIHSLEKQLEVLIPIAPTEAYASVTWDELKTMYEFGVEIGSHTMNHPILSKIPEESLSLEIFESKTHIEQKLQCSVSTFCYPNSAPDDVTELVVETVRKSGYTGAVLGGDLRSWDLYKMPRFGVSDDKTDFMWKLCGGERLSMVMTHATKIS